MKREVARIEKTYDIFDDLAARTAHQTARSQEGRATGRTGELRIRLAQAFDFGPFLAAMSPQPRGAQRGLERPIHQPAGQDCIKFGPVRHAAALYRHHAA